MAGFDVERAAGLLVGLYDKEFGGKRRGRYRISNKHLKHVCGGRRLYAEDMEALRREIYERGCVLVDMETFSILLSQKTFTNFRRVNDGCLSGREEDG